MGEILYVSLCERNNNFFLILTEWRIQYLVADENLLILKQFMIYIFSREMNQLRAFFIIATKSCRVIMQISCFTQCIIMLYNCFCWKKYKLLFGTVACWNLFVLIGSWWCANMQYLFLLGSCHCNSNLPPTHCFCLELSFIWYHIISNILYSSVKFLVFYANQCWLSNVVLVTNYN